MGAKKKKESKTGGKMQGIGSFMPYKVDMKILREYICDGCGMPRKEIEAVKLFSKTGETFVDHTPCDCAAREIFKKQQEEARAEARKRKRAKAMALFEEKSTINRNLINASFLNYKSEEPLLANAKERALLWVAEYNAEEPRNLAFIGSYGTGKSHLAVSTAKALMDNGISCIFITVQKLMTLIKQTFDRGSSVQEGDLLTALEDIDVLILDDIGAEHLSEWSQPKLFEIIDARQGKSTIYTTNLTREELEPRIGGRNVSRMFFKTDQVDMYGTDYRG